MAQRDQTAKEQYDELIAALKDGTHRAGEKNRPVLVWDEYDIPASMLRAEPILAQDGSMVKPAVPHPHAGKHVVTVQYGGHDGGDGGLLKDFAFDPEQIKAKEVEKEPAEPVKEAAKTPKAGM